MLSLEQPSPAVLQSIALRVDGGSATYGDVLKTLYTSATVTQQSPADELARRKAAWKRPESNYPRGVLAKFRKLSSSASKGAVLDGDD